MTSGHNEPISGQIRLDLTDFATTAGKDGYFGRGRLTGYTYWSRSWMLASFYRSAAGHPGRFVYKVIDLDIGDDTPEEVDVGEDERETLEVVLRQRQRFQIKAIVGHEAGNILDFRVQRVPLGSGPASDMVRLDAAEAMILANLFKTLEHLPVEGEEGRRVDDATTEAFYMDPAGWKAAYERRPSDLTRLITDDVTAKDVIALENRRAAVEDMKMLLTDDEHFHARMTELGCGREAVWQKFLEANPWILGVGLAGQLLTSWNHEKLEQVVTGFSISGAGKRVDALLRTAGAVNSMIFAEIKHHQTDLLGQEYRTECWAPSHELSGGVTQIQQTVYRAREDVGEEIFGADPDGFRERQSTWLIRPRSYLILGHSDEFVRDGQPNLAKLRSFELFRRNLYEPEVVTFDELLARAEWHLIEAENAAVSDSPEAAPKQDS